MTNLSINQLILLTLKAVHNGSKRAKNLTTQQFDILRRRLIRRGFITGAVTKDYRLTETGEKLMKDLGEAVVQEITGAK